MNGREFHGYDFFDNAGNLMMITGNSGKAYYYQGELIYHTYENYTANGEGTRYENYRNYAKVS
jgi:hypothetical protein